MNATFLTVKQLKEILESVPDDMQIIIPIASKKDANNILGYRRITSIGILSNKNEQYDALCLAPLSGGVDIATAVDGLKTICKKLLM